MSKASLPTGRISKSLLIARYFIVQVYYWPIADFVYTHCAGQIHAKVIRLA